MADSKFSSQLQNFISTQKGGGAEQRFREEAWQMHQVLGWPSLKTETWRYTNTNKVLQASWQLRPQSTKLSMPHQQWVHEWSKYFDVVVIQNGQLAHAQVSEGCRVQSVQSFWDQLKESDFVWCDGFAPALAASAQGGVWLEISKNNRCPKPMLLVHITEGHEAYASNLNVIRVGSGARARVVEVWLSLGQNLTATNTSVVVGENADLILGRLVAPQEQGRHFHHSHTRVMQHARLNSLNVHLGAAWSRSSEVVELLGDGAETSINGLYFGMNDEHIDQRVEVRHQVARTNSQQFFKGVLRDRARGVMNGKIYIAPQAQKVQSQQMNHNLLLSPGAEADTKPELEVYADDVKANHGASIGRMDEDKIFYLLSRGISHEVAVQLLAQGFIEEVLSKSDCAEIQNFMHSEIQKILPQYSRGLQGEN